MEKFYYCRDGNGHPRVTVCLLTDEDNHISRGISLCSFKDIIRKQEGRNRARGRAMQALISKKNVGSLTKSIDSRTILNAVCQPCSRLTDGILNNFLFLSEFNPKLTEFETYLLTEPKGKHS